MGASAKSEPHRPSVLDPDESWYLPDQVYLAVRPDGASGGPMLELYELGEQRQAVALAYSTLDELITGCGADQPWILAHSDQLPALAEQESGFAFLLLLDESLPGELRSTAAGLASVEASWGDIESDDWTSVYVPSLPFKHGEDQAKLELQPMQGDRLALMAYSSEQSLIAGCGQEQPWVSIPAGLISVARQQSGAHTICLDTPLPLRLRHGSEED